MAPESHTEEEIRCTFLLRFFFVGQTIAKQCCIVSTMRKKSLDETSYLNNNRFNLTLDFLCIYDVIKYDVIYVFN